MPVANQNFTLDGRPIRVGDFVAEVPEGLERLFEMDDDPEGDD